jgi:hypothetical protein
MMRRSSALDAGERRYVPNIFFNSRLSIDYLPCERRRRLLAGAQARRPVGATGGRR